MVDPRHSAHKLWDKTAIVTSQMTESKQEESCSQDQHGDAAPRCIRELYVLTAAEQTNSDKNWIIVCAEGSCICTDRCITPPVQTGRRNPRRERASPAAEEECDGSTFVAASPQRWEAGRGGGGEKKSLLLTGLGPPQGRVKM